MTVRFECQPSILRVQRPRPDGSTLVIEAGEVYESMDPREVADLDQAPGLQRVVDPPAAPAAEPAKRKR